MIHRRGFLTGVFSAFAAPAIVRAGSLMPVRQMVDFEYRGFYSAYQLGPVPVEMVALLKARIDDAQAVMVRSIDHSLYEEDYSPSPLDSLM